LAQALAQARQRPSDQSPSASQADPQASPTALQPARGSHLLRDLAELKSQLRTLLDEVPGPGGVHPATDIHEFHDMIEFGIDHRLLAPIFRTWLQWRSSPQTMRRYLAGDPASPAARMRGESLREWFCHAWTASLTFDTAPATPANGPEILALIGPTGSGKTTTLAKIASKFRLDNRQNNAIVLSLDTHRLDAANQWKQISACLGVPSRTLATQEDAMIWAERIHDYDWVGIDTPGSFAPDSPAGRVYGSLLAQCNQLKTVLTLPATHHDSANRRHLTWAQSLNARHVLFTKLDETDRLGGIVNLTMDHPLALTGFSTGTRVPSDWTMADAHACWHNVLAPADNTALEIAS
jgi:flagellar biosynthesis protein FlhF